MARYECAFTTGAAATNAAIFDIRTSANIRTRVLEIGLFSTAATAVTPTIERQTTLGTTSTTFTPSADEPNDPTAQTVIGTAWSVAPAGSTTLQFRRIALPANIGAGVIWTFGGSGLIIPVSSSIVIMNRLGTTGPVMNGYVVIDE